MGQRLKGKVAVVTGGGSGIGRAIALDLAAEGAEVVVADLGLWTPGKPAGTQSADLVVGEIKKAGGKAVASYDDVAVMAGGENIIKTAIDNFSRIDILVCCAGIHKAGAIDKATEEDFDKLMGVHVKGHFSCIKAAAPHMKRQKSGRIITFSSTGALGSSSLSILYGTAKAAILGLTRSLALELADYGIAVNCILPSAITPLFSKDKKAAHGLPVPKPAGPEMLAPFVVYLACDEAHDINGQFFYAGGGDIALFSQPKPAVLLHKSARWTLDELVDIVPDTLGVSLARPALPEQKHV